MTLPKQLQRLIDDLDGLTAAPPEQFAQGVTAALRLSVLENDWLPPERRGV